MNVKNLLVRACSGAIYVAVIVAATVLGNPWFWLLVALLAIWATWEYYSMTQHRSMRTYTYPGMDILTVLCVAMSTTFPVLMIMLPVLLLIRSIMTLYDKARSPMRSMAYSVLGYVYIGLPLMFLCLLEHFDYRLVLILFCALWINDTGAYLVGSICGRHKLFERISPKKTWEGFVGGLALNVIIALVITLCFPGLLIDCCCNSPIIMVGTVITISVIGTFGDLFESMLKRTAGVKDSGNLIPGHGGILDRIDSMLFAVIGMILMLFLFNAYLGIPV